MCIRDRRKIRAQYAAYHCTLHTIQDLWFCRPKFASHFIWFLPTLFFGKKIKKRKLLENSILECVRNGSAKWNEWETWIKRIKIGWVQIGFAKGGGAACSKFVSKWANQNLLKIYGSKSIWNSANWNDANQVQKSKLVEPKLEGKGQRASYKLDTSQRT